MLYFGEPVGRVKIQATSKNSQRYYTTKRLIKDLLSNTPKFYVRVGEFRGYLFTGNAWQKYAKRSAIGAGNPANWLVNGKQTCLTGPLEYKYRVTFVLVLGVICSWIIRPITGDKLTMATLTCDQASFFSRWERTPDTITWLFVCRPLIKIITVSENVGDAIR